MLSHLGFPLRALAALAFCAAIVSLGEAKYFDVVGFGGLFLLCVMGLYAVAKHRARDRWW